MEYIDWQEKIIKEHKEKTTEKELKKANEKLERLKLQNQEGKEKNEELHKEIFETYEKMLRTDQWKVEEWKERARAGRRYIEGLEEGNNQLREAIAIIKKKMEEDGTE
jgi:hypothetical protein